MNIQTRRFNPYLFTILVVATITLFKSIIIEFVEIESPLLLFFTAVTISAWFGGRNQGFLATLLTVLCADYFFLEPYGFGWNNPTYNYRFALYILDCTVITLLCAELKRYKEEAYRAGTKVDLTQRSLRESELRFRRVYDSNMIGLLFGNHDGTIYEANDYFLNMIGYTREEFSSKKINWKNLTPPEYHDLSIAALKQLNEKGLLTPFEKEYIRKDGTRVPIIVGSSSLDKNNYVSFILDITDRKKAESIITDSNTRLEEMVLRRTQELTKTTGDMRQSQNFLDSVIENIPNMIFVKDAKELKFVRFNKAGEELLGYHREALMNKNDYDFFPKEQADFFTEKDRMVLRGKVVVDIPEEPLSTKDGIRFLHTKKIPILGKDGEPQYLLGISEDITARKDAELQRLVLLQEQASSRAKSAFLANMSHEIRTPLGAMLGFADLILEGNNLSAEQSNYLSTIIRNGKQLYRIVDEILDLSKVESDTINLERLSFSLTKVLDDVNSLLEIQARNKNLDLKITYANTPPAQIVADPTRLRQILINVIGNAIKFTPQGGVEVIVKSNPSNHDISKMVIEFQIKDSGIGITEEQAQKLFQPFAQADDSMTRKYGGTGLGLFLSRKLAKLLGGDLILEQSLPNQGSTFLLTVEVDLSKKIKSEINEYENADAQAQPLLKKTLGKILIVDDVADNRALITHHVTRMGFEPETAENGEEGLNKALHKTYDIILMDLQMPDMDGFEAVKKLRRANYTAPIIALTAHAMKGDREKCLTSGFDDYLCKPINKELLRESVFRFFEKRN